MRVLAIGEVLWDVFPEQELLGGAALNFCANSQRLGNAAALITAVGSDLRGERVLGAMEELGLTVRFVQTSPSLATGTAIIQRDEHGEASFEIGRPAAFDAVSLSLATVKQAEELHPEWLYFGTLLHTSEAMEQTTLDLIASLPSVRCFYDMNLRTGHWNHDLVRRLSGLASVVKLNEHEARTLACLSDDEPSNFDLHAFCRNWADSYEIAVICVTLGSDGCFVYSQGKSIRIPGYSVAVCDTVGAGDAFAAAFLHGYHNGWPLLKCARFANGLGALVASRAGAVPAWEFEECLALIS